MASSSFKKEFSRLLAEKMKDRGIDAKDLARKTGISKQHIEALLEARGNNFPPTPYLRGYLIRLGKLLDFDGADWWKKLSGELILHRSGEQDRLPDNQFARHLPNAWKWWVAGIIVLLLIFGVLRTPYILGVPALSVSAIGEQAGTGVIQSESQEFELFGTTDNADTLYVGGEQIPLGESGSWQKSILLQPGLNTIEVRAEKFLGKSITKVVRIIYEPPATQPTEEQSSQEPRSQPDTQNNTVIEPAPAPIPEPAPTSTPTF